MFCGFLSNESDALRAVIEGVPVLMIDTNKPEMLISSVVGKLYLPLLNEDSVWELCKFLPEMDTFIDEWSGAFR